LGFPRHGTLWVVLGEFRSGSESGLVCRLVHEFGLVLSTHVNSGEQAPTLFHIAHHLYFRVQDYQ